MRLKILLLLLFFVPMIFSSSTWANLSINPEIIQNSPLKRATLRSAEAGIFNESSELTFYRDSRPEVQGDIAVSSQVLTAPSESAPHIQELLPRRAPQTGRIFEPVMLLFLGFGLIVIAGFGRGKLEPRTFHRKGAKSAKQKTALVKTKNQKPFTAETAEIAEKKH